MSTCINVHDQSLILTFSSLLRIFKIVRNCLYGFFHCFKLRLKFSSIENINLLNISIINERKITTNDSE